MQTGIFGWVSAGHTRTRSLPPDALLLEREEARGAPRVMLGCAPRGKHDLAQKDGLLVALSGAIENRQALWEEERPRLEDLSEIRQGDATLVALRYRAEGEKFLASLEGAFSLAIWDEARGALLLARDRVGRHTLYFQGDQEEIVFASNIPLFLEVTGRSLSLDEAGLHAYLTWGYIPTPSSGLKGLSRLPAGNLLLANVAQPLLPRPYWDLRVPPRVAPRRDPPAEAARRVRELLLQAASRALPAETPAQVILGSGVVGASLLGMYPKRLRLTQVTVGAEAEAEAEQARALARRLGVEARVVVYGEEGGGDLSRPQEAALFALQHLDEPCADPGILWWSLATELASLEGEEALTSRGEELIFGLEERLLGAARLERLPRLARLALFRAVSLLPARLRKQGGKADLLRQNAHLSLLPLSQQVQARLSLFHEEIGWKLGEESVEGPEGHLRAPRGAHPIDRLFYATFKSFLADYVLAPFESLSQARGVRLSSPLCDTRLVEYAAALPRRSKTKKEPPVLKEAFPEVKAPSFRGPKGVPIDQWIRGPLRTLCGDMLSAPGARISGLIDMERTKRLLDDHLAERASHGQSLFGLLSLEVWLQKQATGNRS